MLGRQVLRWSTVLAIGPIGILTFYAGTLYQVRQEQVAHATELPATTTSTGDSTLATYSYGFEFKYPLNDPGNPPPPGYKSSYVVADLGPYREPWVSGVIFCNDDCGPGPNPPEPQLGIQHLNRPQNLHEPLFSAAFHDPQILSSSDVIVDGRSGVVLRFRATATDNDRVAVIVDELNLVFGRNILAFQHEEHPPGNTLLFDTVLSTLHFLGQ